MNAPEQWGMFDPEPSEVPQMVQHHLRSYERASRAVEKFEFLGMPTVAGSWRMVADASCLACVELEELATFYRLGGVA